jgi:Tfp pilus assembly protein PilF
MEPARSQETASAGASKTHFRLSGKNPLLRDSLTFLVLLLVTVTMYAATSFLFRSFETRRAELAKEFEASGREAMQGKDPAKAIEALRTALEYAPDDRDSHMLLAEALAEGNHTEEATDYFLNLRDAEPANGWINLQLARLYRRTGDRRRAVDAYRAATLGNWDNDGVEQRLQADMELSDYLIQRGELGPARTELLFAAANAPDSASFNILLGDKLLQANAPAVALARYKRAIKLDPHNLRALAKAGQLSYNRGDYAGARKLLELALREKPEPEQAAQLSRLSGDAERVLRLYAGADLPFEERVEHLRLAAPIAKRRFDACAAEFPVLQAPLLTLKARWQAAADVAGNLRLPAQGMDAQNAAQQLLFDTEVQTAQACGAPTDDDALLLMLARTPQHLAGGTQ